MNAIPPKFAHSYLKMETTRNILHMKHYLILCAESLSHPSCEFAEVVFTRVHKRMPTSLPRVSALCIDESGFIELHQMIQG